MGRGPGVEGRCILVSAADFNNDNRCAPVLNVNQLSEMANEPYWHVSLTDKSYAPRWKILDPLIAANPTDYEYGLEWIAYAYPPINVDDIPFCCECRSCGNCIYDGMSGRTNPCFVCMKSGDMKYFSPVGYCRRCGKPLTAAARAILRRRIRGLESRQLQRMREITERGIIHIPADNINKQ